MRIEDRHRQIVEQVRGAGRVLVTELAEHFNVTPETIRRDLTALDRNGALRKVHGGAIPAPALPETGVTQREQVNPTAKQAIARAALARLAPKPGTTLLIDAGTTTGSLARLLPGDTDLTVITNSVLTAASLAAAGVSAAHGMSTPDPDEATVKRAMVRSARQVVALVDSTKIGQEHLVSFASLDDIDLLVTDVELPPALIDQLATTETEVLVA